MLSKYSRPFDFSGAFISFVLVMITPGMFATAAFCAMIAFICSLFVGYLREYWPLDELGVWVLIGRFFAANCILFLIVATYLVLA